MVTFFFFFKCKEKLCSKTYYIQKHIIYCFYITIRKSSKNFKFTVSYYMSTIAVTSSPICLLHYMHYVHCTSTSLYFSSGHYSHVIKDHHTKLPSSTKIELSFWGVRGDWWEWDDRGGAPGLRDRIHGVLVGLPRPLQTPETHTLPYNRQGPGQCSSG